MSRRDFPKRYKLFAQRLQQARELSGKTQLEAARELSKTQSWISKCETGERRVDILELAEFARIYDISDLSWFLEFEEVP